MVDSVTGVSTATMPTYGFDDLISAGGIASDSYFGVNGTMFPVIQRYAEGYLSSLDQYFNNFENQDIAQVDRINLEPLADAINQFRGPFGKRYDIERDRITDILSSNENITSGQNKVVALYQIYCAKYGGLKDPKGSVNFRNLKDPGLLVRRLQNHSLTAGGTDNKDIELLSRAAIKGNSPELAALILHNSKSGATIQGVNDNSFNRILVESRQQFQDEGTYNRFVANVASVYESITGQSLEKTIRRQYRKPGLFFTIFGANKQGREYLRTLDNARKSTHNINPQAMTMTTMGLGMF